MAKQPVTEGNVRVLVLRDFWPTENEQDRVRAGSVIEVTKDELIDGMEAGIYERVKEAE